VENHEVNKILSQFQNAILFLNMTKYLPVDKPSTKNVFVNRPSQAQKKAEKHNKIKQDRNKQRKTPVSSGL